MSRSQLVRIVKLENIQKEKILHEVDVLDNMDELSIRGMSMKNAVSLFIYAKKRDNSTNTHMIYKSNMALFLKWTKSLYAFNSSKNQLLEYKRYLIDKGFTSSTINTKLSTVRSFYAFLVESEILNGNPSISLKNVKDDNHLKRATLSRDEIQTVYSFLLKNKTRHSLRNMVLFKLLIMNGLRISEARNIRIKDISSDDGIKVIYLNRKGCIGRDSKIVLQEKTYKAIVDFVGDRTSGYLFISDRTMDKLHPDSISRIIKSMFRDCGIDSPKKTANSLRHTYAILALEGGADIVQLMESMNHVSINSTQKYLKSYDRIKNPAEYKVDLDL